MHSERRPFYQGAVDFRTQQEYSCPRSQRAARLGCDCPQVTLQHQGREGTRLTSLSFHTEDLILTLVGPKAREQTKAYGFYV
ncbi:hypothetical protein H671_7g18156 [Cricetulus griseus]|nr:hypothetical protein H671_7g18156 [Cricetulus griseus]